MADKYVIYIHEQDVEKLGPEFMKGKSVGLNHLTIKDVNYWFNKIFNRKPYIPELTKVGGGKRKSKRNRKSHKKKRKSKRKKSRKSKKTKKRRR